MSYHVNFIQFIKYYIMVRLKKSPAQALTKVQTTDLLAITLPLINRMKMEDKSDQTITSYVRSVELLVRFQDMVHPRDMDTVEVLDFLSIAK